MEGRLGSDLRAAARAHQERVLVARGQLIGWLTITGTLVLWALSVMRPLASIGESLPLLNTIELCILTGVVTQMHRPWCRRHILGLSTVACVQMAAFLALYGLWTGNLWILSLRLATLNLVTAAVLPWGIARQGVVAATSALAFAFVHWSLNGTLDHPSTIPTLILSLFSLPIAGWLHQAQASLGGEIERRRTAERALRQATESAKVAVWDADLWALTVSFISGWKHLLGRSESQVILARLWELVHPDDRGQATAALQEHLQGRRSTYESEHRMLHADGSYRWVLSRGIATYDAEGRPCRLLGADIDVSDRKRLEEALEHIEARKHAEQLLRESEERFRLITETIEEVFWMADVELRNTFYISPGYERIWGRTRDSLYRTPQSFLDAIHPEDRERISADLEVKQNGLPFDNEYRIIQPDGSIRYIWDRGFPVRNATGPVRCYVGVAQDITERRRADQMKQRHQRETTLINNILRAINTHLDVSVAFPAVCAGLRELAGCAAVSLNLFDERREWLTFTAADAPWALGVSERVCLAAAEFPAVPDVLAGRPHVVGDLATELRFPLVQIVYNLGFRSVVSLPLSAGSKVVGFLNLFWREVDGSHAGEMALLTQVTNAVAIAVEKGRLFEQVTAAHERLEALTQRLLEVQETERRRLAHELHDEIGQTVTGMGFLLDTIDGLSAPMASARLEQVKQLVSELVAQIRNLSLNLRPSMLDDLGLVPALLWLFGRYTAQTNVQVDFDHQGLERRFDPEIETVAYRVVQEALTNVARHARVDQVSVRGWLENGSLLLEVRDDGTGFEPGTLNVATASLGLAGMRERASQIGGRLALESEPGAGTRVRVQLPVRIDATVTPAGIH